MKVLLDTHAFLWWVAEDSKLSVRARRIIGSDANELFLSAASVWEIVIKASLSRLNLGKENPETVVTQGMAANGIRSLQIELHHALRTYSLPNHHNDPFDRMLIA
jgi:PIN domain nuclease of toxin-antitoxin system